MSLYLKTKDGGQVYYFHVGAGWISSLLQHERNSWSDESGSVSMPPKDDFPIPTVAELTELDGENQNGKLVWVEEDWELDLKWTEVDQDGWEYSNQNWDNPRPSRVLGSFTRRRKWLRHLKLVETK
jgi:hypothetical protein